MTMGFISKNPRIEVILLGVFFCVMALGVNNLYSANVLGDIIKSGPSGQLSGPLWVLGIVLIFVGLAIQLKSPAVLKS